MNIHELRLLLDARGPDLSGWPASDRQAAEELAERSAEARAALEEARALDALLARTLGRGNAGEALRSAVLRIPEMHPRARHRPGGRFSILAHPWRAGIAAAAASAVLGVIVGSSGIASLPEASETIDLATLVYAQSFDEETLP